MLESLLNAESAVNESGELVVKQTTASQTIPWVVPNGVYSICVVCVGDGGHAGAGLSWRNNIPVSPQEVLTLSIVANSRGESKVTRGGVVLCVAFSGGTSPTTNANIAGGLGGKEANAVNDGGGNGGRGRVLTTTIHIGGGAGGYLGNGGGYALNATDSTMWDIGSGSGSGARVVSGSPATRRVGGSVGLYGIGITGESAGASPSDGNPGSIAEVMCGGGNNISTANFNGGIRIIWGEGYSFPYNAVIEEG